MKKFLLSVLVLSLLMGAATFAWATVIGTPHDLAPEPCAMCHTPHSGTGDYPLWNRLQEAPPYTLYKSISFDMGDTAAVQPRSPSSLCLVCHNGVASELVNYPGPSSNPDGAYDIQVAGWADLGSELKDEHPIGFNYQSSPDLDNNAFPDATPVRTTLVGGNMVNTRYAIKSGETNYYLYGNGISDNKWFECATCHSVHDLGIYEGKGDYQVYFLRHDNTGSEMCLDCHIKR